MIATNHWHPRKACLNKNPAKGLQIGGAWKEEHIDLSQKVPDLSVSTCREVAKHIGKTESLFQRSSNQLWMTTGRMDVPTGKEPKATADRFRRRCMELNQQPNEIRKVLVFRDTPKITKSKI